MTNDSLHKGSFSSFRKGGDGRAARPGGGCAVSLLIAVLLLATASAALGQETAPDGGRGHGSSPPPAPLGYRRVFAPADRIEDWPWGSEKFRPIDAAKLERMLELLSGEGGRDGAAPGISLTTAIYEARWEEDVLVDGSAAIQVRNETGGQGRLAIEECNLALREARWADRDGEDAALGTDPDGQMELLVTGSGHLEFAWSLRGVADGAGASFALSVLPALSSGLRLDLPEGFVPEVDHGIVLGSTRLASGRRRWKIDLGGHRRCQLRIVDSGGERKSSANPRARQSIVYNCSMRAVEVQSHIAFDPYDRGARRVVLWLDPGLEPLKASFDGESIGFAIVPEAGPNGERGLEFNLPESTAGARRELSLTAFVPLVLKTAWPLPRIRLDQSDVFWQETETTLLLERPLILEELESNAARAVASEVVPGPSPTESVTLRYNDPDARVTVRLAGLEPVVTCDSGTLLHLRYGEMMVDMAAEFRIADGHLFVIEGSVAREWTVDSVDVLPGDAGASWDIETADDGRQALVIRLAQPLEPSRAIRLRVTGHRSSLGYQEALTADGALPVRFDDSFSGRHLLALETSEANRLELSGSDADDALDAPSCREDHTFFPETPTGVVLRDATTLDDLIVSLREVKSDFNCQIETICSVTAGALRQIHSIRCTPLGGPVERIVVELADPPPDVRWSLAGSENRPLAVRSLEDARMESGATRVRRRWEITLAPARREPFVLRGESDAPLDGPRAASLVSLPDAESTTGKIYVVSDADAEVRIRSVGLKSLPLAKRTWDNARVVRRLLAWDPSRRVATDQEMALVLAPLDSDPPVGSAWIWNGRLESRYESTGQARHRLIYWIENRGASRLRVTLPSPIDLADVQGVWVADRRATWRAHDEDATATLEIPLPVADEFPRVVVQFTEQAPPLGAWTQLTAPRCTTDLPQMQGHWLLWLPPRYRAALPGTRFAEGGGFLRPWKQRLLQPLRSGASQTVFDPVDPMAWASPLGRHPQKAAVRETVELLLAGIATQCRPRPSSARQPTPDWGTVLTAASLRRGEDVAAPSPLTLLIDQEALDRAGITPRTPAPRPVEWQGSDDVLHGQAILEEAGLALLAHEEAIVVTTDVAASRLDRTEAIGDGRFHWVTPGALYGRIAAASTQPGAAYLSVSLWNSQTADVRTPWSAGSSLLREPAETRGWSVQQMTLDREGGTRITVIHEGTVETARWLAFLAVAGLAVCRFLGRRLLVLLAGTMALAALFVPVAVLPVVSGTIAGCACGFGFHLVVLDRPRGRKFVKVRRLPPRGSAFAANKAEEESASSAGDSRSSVRMPTLLFAAALAAGASFAQTPIARAADPVTAPASGDRAAAGPADVLGDPSEGGETSQTVDDAPLPYYHPIFIPVDESADPKGDLYYVSQRFHDLLNARVRQVSGRSVQWQYRSAWYRGRLARTAVGEPPRLERLSVVYEFRVFKSPASIRIPLEGALPTAAKLDGAPIEPRWQDKDGLVFDVPRTGPCRLELLVRPPVKTDGNDGFLSIRIPPVADARLDFEVPADLVTVEAPSARGLVARKTPTSLHADLGPVDRLELRWTEDPSRRVSGPTIECEELSWLKIRAGGAVVLQMRFRYLISEGSLQELRLSIDPHLSRPIRGFSCDVADVTAFDNISGPPLPDQAELFRVQLSKPVTGQVVLSAEFVVNDFSGGGRLRVPMVHSADGRIVRRLMAVSADPTLVPPAPGARKTVAASTFRAAWGGEPETPLFAVELEADPGSWSVEVAPKPLEVEATESLDLHFGDGEVDLRYEGTLTPSNMALQYHLRVPNAMRIERLTVADATSGADLLSRWTRIDAKTVALRLSEPTAESHRLLVEGRVDIPVGLPSALPILELREATTQDYQLRLYRHFDVLLDTGALRRSLSAEQIPPAVEAEDVADGRQFVEAYRVDDPTHLVHDVVVLPNTRIVSARQLTLLRQEDTGWIAEFRFELDVDRGVLDEIHLRLPSSLIGTPPRDLDKSLQVVSTPDTTDDPLVLRPRKPIETGFRFSFSAPMNFPPGEPVRAPHVSMVELARVEHTIVLPRQSKNLMELSWQGRGVQPIEVPEEAVTLALRDAHEAYRVVDRSFDLLRRPSRAEPEVHTVDARFSWDDQGGVAAITVMDLGPTSLEECLLAVPEGYELLQVTVGGVSVLPSDAGQGRWRIPLGGNLLPRRIETVLRGRIEPPRAREELALPIAHLEKLSREPLPVRRTFWAAAAPRQYTFEADGAMPRTRFELERFRILNDLVETADSSRGDDQEELRAWYDLWCKRWVTACRRVRYLAARYDDAGVENEVGIIEARQRLLARNLGLADRLRTVESSEESTDLPTQLWEKARAGGGAVFRASVDGAASEARIVYWPVASDPLNARLLWAAIFLLLTLAILSAMRVGRIVAFFRRWPHLAIVVFGLIWWLWFWPSILGFLIAVIGVASSLWPGWRSGGANASTIRKLHLDD